MSRVGWLISIATIILVALVFSGVINIGPKVDLEGFSKSLSEPVIEADHSPPVSGTRR